MNQKVSVIIPVYDVEKYVEACLDSVLSQTYKNLEIIIVNDASPGNINSLVKMYQHHHENIKLINLDKNVGLFRARIRGMNEANGEYIVNIDGDDTVSVDFIERMMERALDTGADVVIGEMLVYDGKSKVKKILNNAKSIGYDEIIDGNGAPLQELMRKDNFFWEVCGKMYRASTIQQSLKDLEKINHHIIMGEDLLFNMHIFYYCKKLARVEFAFYNYLINEGSATAKSADVAKKEKNLTDLIFVLDTVKDFMQRKGIYEKYTRQYRHIRNMQAAKYYSEIQEDFRGREKSKLLSLIDSMSFDKHGLEREVAAQNSIKYDNVNDLVWQLESMNSIKTSGKKLLSNIKRKIMREIR